MSLCMKILKTGFTRTAVKHIYPRLLGVTSSTCIRSHKCSTEAAIPLPTESKEYPPQIQQIVDQIGQLTLLEVADLNELLKSTLKISDAPMAMMPAGGMMAGAAPAKAEEEEPAPVASLVCVKLTGFDAPKKVALIKQVKGIIEGMNLVQAKKFVETLPQTVKTDLTKEDAEALKAQLEAAGAVVALEDVF